MKYILISSWYHLDLILICRSEFKNVMKYILISSWSHPDLKKTESRASNIVCNVAKWQLVGSFGNWLGRLATWFPHSTQLTWLLKCALATGIHALANLTERFAGALGNCFFTHDRSPETDHTYTRIHRHRHTYTQTHIYADTHIRIRTYTQTHIYTDTSTHIHRHTYTRTHIYTYAHIHGHTYTHTHIYTVTQRSRSRSR